MRWRAGYFGARCIVLTAEGKLLPYGLEHKDVVTIERRYLALGLQHEAIATFARRLLCLGV